MAIDYTDTTTPTDVQLLAQAKRCLYLAYEAFETGKGDRRMTSQRISELRADIENLEARIVAAGVPNDCGIILAEFK
jgi:hypothetical protein